MLFEISLSFLVYHLSNRIKNASISGVKSSWTTLCAFMDKEIEIPSSALDKFELTSSRLDPICNPRSTTLFNGNPSSYGCDKMLGIFVRIITITLESSQGRFNLLLFPQGLVMLFDLLVLRWRYLWTRADGGGELASRRNKKTRDFTQPFPHKSTLLSIPIRKPT